MIKNISVVSVCKSKSTFCHMSFLLEDGIDSDPDWISEKSMQLLCWNIHTAWQCLWTCSISERIFSFMSILKTLISDLFFAALLFISFLRPVPIQSDNILDSIMLEITSTPLQVTSKQLIIESKSWETVLMSKESIWVYFTVCTT